MDGLHLYGVPFDPPPGFNQLSVELASFGSWYRHPTYNGPGRLAHFKTIQQYLWQGPHEIRWHPWLEDQIASLCAHQQVSWNGCGASGKTFASGLYAMVWWLADPLMSTVLLTSTTGKMIRKRVWPVIQKLHSTCIKPGFPGNMVDSKTTLQARKGDDKNAIFAVAVADGNTAKAVGDIQGIHNRRILVMIDEAPETPAAAFEACVNLEKGCSDFQLLAAGNPVSMLDQHGRFSEPRDGWGSVSVESEEWPTRTGICLHFDGTKSPGLHDPSLGFLYSAKDLELDMRLRGPESPAFWKFCRGFYAPEGICQTVFSDAMVIKHDGRGKHIFRSQARPVAALDPAFGGGDRCVLRFGMLGDLEDGRMALQLTESIQLDLKAESKDYVHMQIAEQVRAQCEKRGVEPEDFAMDTTGEGGGLAEHIVRTWGSNAFHRVEFGGRASDRPVSLEDKRSCHDVYRNRVTELWYSARAFLQGGQLKGLNQDEISEFTSRQYELKGALTQVEPKSEMKARFGRSPDHADAVAVLVELARHKGASAGTVKSSTRPNREWDKAARASDDIYEEVEAVAGEPFDGIL